MFEQPMFQTFVSSHNCGSPKRSRTRAGNAPFSLPRAPGYFFDPKCRGESIGINQLGHQLAECSFHKRNTGKVTSQSAAAAQEAFESVLLIDAAALGALADQPFHRVIVRRKNIVDVHDDAGLQHR